MKNSVERRELVSWLVSYLVKKIVERIQETGDKAKVDKVGIRLAYYINS